MSSPKRKKRSSTKDRQKARASARGKAPKLSAGSRAKVLLKEIMFALIMVLLIQTFAFANFHVPTPSMEATVMTGDRIFASKLHYGPRTPTSIGIPFTGIHIPGVHLPFFRLPGFSEPKAGDVIVFNLPVEEKPIDQKQPYLKRLIGLPGDEIELRDKQVYVNGSTFSVFDGMQEDYLVEWADPTVSPPASRYRDLGLKRGQARLEGPGMHLVSEITAEQAEEIAGWTTFVKSVKPRVLDKGDRNELFPKNKAQNVHQYGPIAVPAKGDVIELNRQTWPTYEKVVTLYEGHEASLNSDGTVTVNGEVTETLTLEKDYYFAMGDNRDNSWDSRAWGFIPHDHLMGKASIIYWSWDSENNRPRLGRIGTILR